MTEIEIGYDWREEVQDHALLMDERHEILPDGEWIRHIRQVFKKPDLFVYYHKETGKFVLALMILTSEKWGSNVCQELETMDLPPDRGGWIPTEELRLRMIPEEVAVEKMKRHMWNCAQRKRDLKRESAEERADKAKHLLAQGKVQASLGVAQGPFVGEREGGERLAEMKDEMNRVASTKVYTTG